MKSIRSLFPIHSGKAIFSVWLVCLPVFLIGQVYNVSRYTTADNLVQSQVMALFQDHQGYLWFGTHGGPCKYDGQNFFAIPKDSLAGNFLTDIWEDQDRNHMYFATRSGLTVFDGTTYQTISLPGGEDPVWCMEPDGNGNLWIGTQSQGIQIINLETRQLIQSEDHNSSPIEDRAILSIARGDNRSFWIGTNQGVFQSSDGHILTPWKEEEIRDEVYDIFVSNSRVYFGTNQGAFLWTRRFLVRFLPTQFGGDDDGVFCFAEDREGQIWMGTRKGVLFLDNEGNVQPL
ncbi:MAG: two-component regulator propeller domain-containing protein, partial [Bacteroidota bacterium]